MSNHLKNYVTFIFLLTYYFALYGSYKGYLYHQSYDMYLYEYE